MDKEKLTKFLPVLGSPLWAKLEEDVLLPKLEILRTILEAHEDPEVRGQIKLIRYLLGLKTDAKNMEN